MQKIIFEELSQIITDIPFNRMLGLRLKEINDESIAVSFAMKEELVGNFVTGILHGGVISSVLDMAGGVVAMVFLLQRYSDKGVDELKKMVAKASTVNLQISYIQPGRGQHFTATAKILHGGNKLCFTHTALSNETGKLIATGEATYLIG